MAGTTYSSGVGLTERQEDGQEEEIPPPVQEPQLSPVRSSAVTTIVYVDVETTGRSANEYELTQLAALHKDADGKEVTFSVNVLPAGNIERGASAVTHLSIGHRSG